MAIRVRAYTSTPSGGPATASWRFWHERIFSPEMEKASSVIERNKHMIQAYDKWLLINYGAHLKLPQHIPVGRYTEMEFQDEAIATLFLMRFL